MWRLCCPNIIALCGEGDERDLYCRESLQPAFKRFHVKHINKTLWPLCTQVLFCSRKSVFIRGVKCRGRPRMFEGPGYHMYTWGGRAPGFEQSWKIYNEERALYHSLSTGRATQRVLYHVLSTTGASKRALFDDVKCEKSGKKKKKKISNLEVVMHV